MKEGKELGGGLSGLRHSRVDCPVRTARSQTRCVSTVLPQSSLRRMSTTLTEDDAQSVGSIGSRRSGTSFMSGSRRYRSKAITGEQPNFMRATSSKQLKMVTPHLEARSISKKVHHIEVSAGGVRVQSDFARAPEDGGSLRPS